MLYKTAKTYTRKMIKERKGYSVRYIDRRNFLRQSVLTGLTGAAAVYGTRTVKAEVAGESNGSSERLYEELYRPRFHFTAKHGWMNDPNGLVFYKGKYHLFFQHTEDVGRPFSKTQWGHAISKNLVHWQQLEPAILAEDGHGAFSGSCVVDWNNTTGFKSGSEVPIVAAYTSWGRGQFIAYSNDRCRTFHSYKGNPILKHPNDSKSSFPLSPRDPMVLWYEKGGYWVLLMYQNIEGKKGFGIYTSADMKEWKFASHLPGFYVCPDLFQLPLDGDVNDLRWVIMDWEKYAIGDFDGKSFTLQTDTRRLDEASGPGTSVGLGASANQTWKVGPPGDGRIIQIAWLREGHYPNMPFSQQMTFPTRLSLRTYPEGIRLCREPAREIELLYERSHKINADELRPDSTNPLADIKPDFLDIQAEFKLGTEEMAEQLSLNVRGVPIVYDLKSKKVSCLGRSENIEPVEQRLGIRALVDRTSLEVYVDGGRLVFTFYHFFDPAKKDLTLSVRGGLVRLNSLDIHEIKSVWSN